MKYETFDQITGQGTKLEQLTLMAGQLERGLRAYLKESREEERDRKPHSSINPSCSEFAMRKIWEEPGVRLTAKEIYGLYQEDCLESGAKIQSQTAVGRAIRGFYRKGKSGGYVVYFDVRARRAEDEYRRPGDPVSMANMFGDIPRSI